MYWITPCDDAEIDFWIASSSSAVNRCKGTKCTNIIIKDQELKM